MYQKIKISDLEKRKIISNYLFGEIDGKKIIFLLEKKIVQKARMSAKKLLKLLVSYKYHTYGLHNKGSLDKNMHYTIIFRRGHKGIHLQVDNKGFIWRITDHRGLPLSGQLQPWY